MSLNSSKIAAPLLLSACLLVTGCHPHKQPTQETSQEQISARSSKPATAAPPATANPKPEPDVSAPLPPTPAAEHNLALLQKAQQAALAGSIISPGSASVAGEDGLLREKKVLDSQGNTVSRVTYSFANDLIKSMIRYDQGEAGKSRRFFEYSEDSRLLNVREIHEDKTTVYEIQDLHDTSDGLVFTGRLVSTDGRIEAYNGNPFIW